jgi:hypothetical protein
MVDHHSWSEERSEGWKEAEDWQKEQRIEWNPERLSKGDGPGVWAHGGRKRLGWEGRNALFSIEEKFIMHRKYDVRVCFLAFFLKSSMCYYFTSSRGVFLQTQFKLQWLFDEGLLVPSCLSSHGAWEEALTVGLGEHREGLFPSTASLGTLWLRDSEREK